MKSYPFSNSYVQYFYSQKVLVREADLKGRTFEEHFFPYLLRLIPLYVSLKCLWSKKTVKTSDTCIINVMVMALKIYSSSQVIGSPMEMQLYWRNKGHFLTFLTKVALGLNEKVKEHWNPNQGCFSIYRCTFRIISIHHML